MNKALNTLSCFAVAGLLLLSSCANNEVTKEEKLTIETRDSVSRNAADVRNKLDEQTQKVEASIEKLDEEFDNK